jgi:purine-binding chemotaxis protein CheW
MTETQNAQTLDSQEQNKASIIDLDGDLAEIQQILEQRAERLAQAPIEEDTGEQMTLVLVRLGREIYGLDARYVGRIRPVEHITRVPRVPDWVAGVTNLRGHVLSVVDLRTLFGLPVATGNGQGKVEAANGDEQNRAYLVAVETPEMELALQVDAVLSVVSMPVSQIQATTSAIRGLRADHVIGIGKWQASSDDNERLLAVLDLPALMRDERLVIHEEVV